MSIRLLMFTAETHPTYRADVAALFGKYLPRLGVHSDLVAGFDAQGAGAPPWAGGAQYLCSVTGGESRQHLVTLTLAIRHLMRTRRGLHDAIQVRDRPILGLFAALIARLKGIPFVYWMSYPVAEGQIELARERGLRHGVAKFLVPWLLGRVRLFVLYRWVLPLSGHVFVQSDQMRQDVARQGLPLTRMTVVPMGVDLAALDAAALVPPVDERLRGRQVLAYLGTLDPPRQIERLFGMLALVRQQAPDALLLLVGDTNHAEHRTWLEQQAKAAGVADHVLWTGWLPMVEGWRYLSAAAVALSPIPRGPLLDAASPTKVCEYLALGLAVVCNDNPDQAEIIRQSGAGRCVPYTAAAFAAAALELLACDAQQRSDMARAGRRFVEAYRDYPLIACQVAMVYQQLLAPGRATASNDPV